MKITKKQLKQIVKEELEKALMEDVEVTEQGCKRARNILDSEQFGDSASASDFEEKYGMAPHPYYQKCP